MSIATNQIVQYEETGNVLETFKNNIVSYLVANCLNCKENADSAAKAIDKRFIPGTELQRLRVSVVRGSNNSKRELVLRVASDAEYGFITKTFTRQQIESDLYNYMAGNTSTYKPGGKRIIRDYSSPDSYIPFSQDTEAFTTLKGRIIGTEEFVGGAYGAMLTFLSNRVVRVCGWGLADLSPSYPSSKTKKAYKTQKEFIDAVQSKTRTYVKYFYNDQNTNIISPQKITINNSIFYSNDFIFDYINNNTQLMVLKQVLEFVG